MTRARTWLTALLVACAAPGCELLTGIHEREAAEPPATCPEGRGDCNGDPADGCEIDFAIDAAHCGRCDRGCLGGTCGAGACTPVEIASGQPGPIAIRVRGDFAYWVNVGGTVYKAKKDGTSGVLQLVTNAQAQALGQTSPVALAVDDTSVYWTTLSAAGAVLKVDIDGEDPKVLYEPYNRPAGVVADGTQVFWAVAYEDRILRGPPAGGMPDVLDEVQFGITPFGLALHEGTLYWSGLGAIGILGAVGSVAIDGSAQRVIAEDQDAAFSIAVDATGVYWTNLQQEGFTEGTVMHVPLDCADPCTPTPLATQLRAPNAIAVDDSGVYWTTYGDIPTSSSGGAEGTVMAIRAGEMEPVILAAGQDHPTSIALDEVAIYWTNGTDAGQVMRLAK